MSDAAAHLFALVPCAGIGARAGGAARKQYTQLAGRAMVAHTLAALAGVSRLSATLVVLAADDDQFESQVPGFVGASGWVDRCGGETRAATVANGLRALSQRGADDDDWVLVHDAARCLLRPAWVNALIDAVIDSGAHEEVGGLLALPLADTLKAEVGGRVQTTVDRRGKWAAQTPQMFRLGLLRRALLAAGPDVTDEAGAVELLGRSPRLVAGSMENFKVTYPNDFEIAARLLATANAQGNVALPLSLIPAGDGRPRPALGRS